MKKTIKAPKKDAKKKTQAKKLKTTKLRKLLGGKMSAVAPIPCRAE